MKSKEDRAQALARLARIEDLFGGDEHWKNRLRAVMTHSRKVRTSEYHITNACNIRCRGCWFFEYGHDTDTDEVKSLEQLDAFLIKERDERKINSALVIGGEPTLFPIRLRRFVERLTNVTISSNGLRKLPVQGFENVAIGLTLFGGGPLDDQLRGVKPSGKTFSGLFETALKNYHGDPRAGFIYALNEDGIPFIEQTVQRIRDNGNRVNFNFYSKYNTPDPAALAHQQDLLDEALRVKALYPETVVSHPYYIRAMISGYSHWGAFSYDTCPSISIDNPQHAARLQNGNPTLPFFNTWGADLKTVKFCCTSGHCSGCRDSQAISSWLLVNMDKFLGSREHLQTWVEIAESYWKQFIWGPYHWTKVGPERLSVANEQVLAAYRSRAQRMPALAPAAAPTPVPAPAPALAVPR